MARWPKDRYKYSRALAVLIRISRCWLAAALHVSKASISCQLAFHLIQDTPTLLHVQTKSQQHKPDRVSCAASRHIHNNLSSVVRLQRQAHLHQLCDLRHSAAVDSSCNGACTRNEACCKLKPLSMHRCSFGVGAGLGRVQAVETQPCILHRGQVVVWHADLLIA